MTSMANVRNSKPKPISDKFKAPISDECSGVARSEKPYYNY